MDRKFLRGKKKPYLCPLDLRVKIYWSMNDSELGTYFGLCKFY